VLCLAKVLVQGIATCPIVMGLARREQIVTSEIALRGLVNMMALAVVDAQAHKIKDHKSGSVS
jgi:phosphotransacetylase